MMLTAVIPSDVLSNPPILLGKGAGLVNMARHSNVPVEPGQWYEVTIWYAVEAEETGRVDSLAFIQVAFQGDGQSIPPPILVPGLMRANSGRFGRYVPHPKSIAVGTSYRQGSPFSFQFRVPDTADMLSFSVEPWNAKRPIHFYGSRVRQVGSSTLAKGWPTIRRADTLTWSKRLPREAEFKLSAPSLPLGDTPIEVQTPILGGIEVEVNGKLEGGATKGPWRALAWVDYLDSRGAAIPGPYYGTNLGNNGRHYIYLPTTGSMAFKRRLVAPPGARSLRLRLQSWFSESALYIKSPIHVRLGDFAFKQAVVATDKQPNIPSWLPEKLAPDVAIYRVFFGDLPTADPHNGFPPSAGFRAPTVESTSGDFHVHSMDFEGVLRDQFKFSTYPGFSIPKQPSWTEDPFTSTTWRQNWHALSWLLAYPRAKVGRLDPDRIARFRFLVNSWLDANPSPWKSVDTYAWDDHAAALRAKAFLMFLKYREGLLDSALELRLIASLMVHAEALNRFLDDERFFAHNHNLFHAIALLRIAAAFPRARFSSEWRVRAETRIFELFNELISDEGLGREQAGEYHVAVLTSFLESIDTLDALGSEETKPQLERMRTGLSRALRSTSILARPDQTYPQYGDGKSYAGVLDELKLFVRANSDDFRLLQNPFASRQGLEAASTGTAKLYLFPESGYAVFRNDSAAQQGMQHVFIDYSPQVHSHGHYDSGSFTYWSQGIEWIIDSGGPYKYDDYRLLTYLRSSRAHNVCGPLGFRQREGESVVTKAGLGAAGELDLGLSSFVYGPDAKYRSHFSFRSDGELHIRVRFETAAPVPVECRLHLHPDVTVTPHLEKDEALLSRGRNSVILSFGSKHGAPQFSVAIGRLTSSSDTDLDGLVSRSAGKLESTTVIRLVFPSTEFPAEFSLRPAPSKPTE